ncbi:MAG: proline dehydrogenase family protein [Candidatus Latescibacterota bacterium]
MDDLTRTEDPALEAAVQRLGRALWQEVQGQVPGLFARDYWQGQVLEWAMRDPEFRVDLFRFVDVLPALRTPRQVCEHVRQYLLRDGRQLPGLLEGTLRAATGRLTRALAARVLRRNVGDIARRFITGANLEEALPRLGRLWVEGYGITVDLLGEATLGHAEAERYQRRYLELVDRLAAQAARWPAQPELERNHLGALPRASVSVKLTALEPQLDAAETGGCAARLRERLLPILLRARQRGVFVNVDMEQWEVHGIVVEAFAQAVLHPELRDWPHLGIAVQAYLRSGHEDVEQLLALARQRGTPLTVRLVKGAYWDHEVVRARQYGYPCPVYLDKAQTDAAFEALTRLLLQHHDLLVPALGSHNLRSLAHGLAAAQGLGVPPEALEVQMLHGMAEPERRALRRRGLRVRLYTPVGELLPGMAYLVRRLLENTANQGFLRLAHREGRAIEEVLAEPRPEPRPGTAPALVPQPGGPVAQATGSARQFANAPLTDFTDANARGAFARAVEAVEARLPLPVPFVVAGEVCHGPDVVEQVCPDRPEELAARVCMADLQSAERAVQAAWEAWPAWRDRSLAERARMLERLACRLEADRLELAALETCEEAKPWRDADADVAEAIDFCRYYARQALEELGSRPHGDVPGEENVLVWEGRGPTVVIPPWNFPLAIPCGMSAAALVAGNPLLLKPAEHSSAVAYELFLRMQEVGFPAGVVHFLPGRGEQVGRFLVEHPLVVQIAFTGSREVGLEVVGRAARSRPGQPQVKRVVCEMGGKNAVVVDEDADLDEAVAGTVQSAFGYAGQKCSAASRAVVVASAWEPFTARLVEATRALRLAPARTPACRLGPVIDREARDRLRLLLADPGPDVEILFRGEGRSDGLYVEPALLTVRDPQHRLMQEELFGPVLTLMRVETFDQALEVAQATAFALAGCVYSRHPGHLREARRRFRVGNLYLNRGCTGARVGRQPFGGFGMSGTGAKAGGPGYLQQFADQRILTENTTRRGFTPGVEW